MSAAIKLLPCPFCTGNAETRKYTGLGWEVACTDCGVSTQWYTRETEAVAAWNMRDGKKQKELPNRRKP